MRTLGYGDDESIIADDPLTNPRTYELLKQHESNRVRRMDVSKVLAKAPELQKITLQQYYLLREVPLNPALRLAEKPKG